MVMKTTLNIDDRLARAVKRLAAERGVTMTQVVEEALRAAVLPPADPEGPFHLEWVTVRGRKPPDVDIADRDALYDHMEGRP